MPVTGGLTKEEQGSDVTFRSCPEWGTYSNTGPAWKFLRLQTGRRKSLVQERKGSTK